MSSTIAGMDDFYARDVQAMGDDAGPEPEPTDATWMWFCRRCRSVLAEGHDFCTDCIRDFWDEAESYGESGWAVHERVLSIRARYTGPG